MKRIFTNNLRNLFAAAILITSANITQAATYRTLTSGTWNDVVSVWSTDGITPCGCSPTTGPGDIVIIDHNITATTNITMNSAMLTVNAAGSINSTARLNVNSGSVALARAPNPVLLRANRGNTPKRLSVLLGGDPIID